MTHRARPDGAGRVPGLASTASMASPSRPGPPPGSTLRFPALVWALLHAPVFVWLYAGSIQPALRAVPEGYRTATAPAFLVQGLVLALVVFLVPLPLSLWGRAYRVGAPLFAGLATVLLSLDARLYATVGFHVNGFFFKVLSQPAALRETGIPTSEVIVTALHGAAWLAGEAVVGAWFLGRFASRRPTWRWALAILLLGTAERFYVGSLTFFGGQAVYAAGQVLPLQAPVRVNAIWSKLTGRPTTGNPLRAATDATAVKLPPGIDPAAVRLERKPDVLFLLLESTRADYFRPEVMPRLWARAAQQGTVFERHYTSCPSTFFAVYSLLFGLHAHTLDAVVGTGRKPVLFHALSAQDYHSRILAASSVDWMGLRETVFGDVKGELETDWPPGMRGDQRDEAIVARAKEHVLATPADRPVFLFLFFFGTHFNYFYPERSARFSPAWDGKDALKATSAPPEQILNRGRNAAYELDWKVDELLQWYERARGRRPLVVITGDHGEEMREKGHLGHGSALVQEQIHTPMVILGDGVPVGRRSTPTSHVDVVPTLLGLLGDRHPPEQYSDGMSMFDAPTGRYVLVNLGWEPRFAAVGPDLKVSFYGMDAGLGGVLVTDPDDRPLPDGEARFAGAVPRILQLFQRPTAR